MAGRRSAPEPPLAPHVAEALAGEILGATLVVEHAPGIVGVPFEGTIVDETLQTLVLRRPGRDGTTRIQKTGLAGTILLGERQLPLRGETLRVRPEDRTKRLTVRGRRNPR